jgi:RimJ/RimL family protein N-acetyltransferase
MNIVLKNWETRDAEALLKYAGNAKITQFMSDGFTSVSTPEGAAKFIAFAGSSEDKIYRAIEVDGEVVGGIGVLMQTDIHCKNAELGYWLAEPFWGKGIITKATEILVSEAFKQLEITRIFARPFHTNKASHRVLEKAGFRLEAVLEKAVFKNGEYLDECIYVLRKPKAN